LITQERLHSYRELKAQAERATRALEAERKQLLAEHEALATVEAGPFRMKVEPRESRPFSYDAVLDLLGRAMADWIKERLPAKSSTVLTVTGP
jgi:hypothetical protein